MLRRVDFRLSPLSSFHGENSSCNSTPPRTALSVTIFENEGMINTQRRRVLQFMHAHAATIPRLDWLDIAAPGKQQNLTRLSALVQDDPIIEIRSIRDIQKCLRAWEDLLIRKEALQEDFAPGRTVLK